MPELRPFIDQSLSICHVMAITRSFIEPRMDIQEAADRVDAVLNESSPGTYSMVDSSTPCSDQQPTTIGTFNKASLPANKTCRLLGPD